MRVLKDDLSRHARAKWDVMSSAKSRNLFNMVVNTEAAFNEAYCRRIQDLRRARKWTQEQMATALGIPLERYKKYETRSPLPMYLVERFALIVGRDVQYIVTGRGSARTRSVA